MKPILFNTEMVKAILDGRKTTTRRVIKPQPYFIEKVADGVNPYWRVDDIGTKGHYYGSGLFDPNQAPEYAPFQKGDILYVRETFAVGEIACGEEPDGTAAEYISQRAGENDIIPKEYALRNKIGIDDVIWKPSIFMPKEAARLFLRVTGVKAERLQDITENGAKAEGMVYTDFGMYQPSWKASVDGGKTFYPAKEQHHFGWNSGSAKGPGECFPTSHGAFAHLWDSTVNKSDLDHYDWSANPWVWVISFERCEKEGAVS